MDDEDQTFLHDQERSMLEDDYEEDDDDANGPDGKKLDMIEEEESHHDPDEDRDNVARKLEEEILEDNSFAPLINDDAKGLHDSQLLDQTQDKLINTNNNNNINDDLEET